MVKRVRIMSQHLSPARSFHHFPHFSKPPLKPYPKQSKIQKNRAQWSRPMNDTVTIRAKHKNEEGRTIIEKVELQAHKVETLRHISKKLVDTGVHRLDRHPADGKGSVKKPPPKKGHGGKYTWEGPESEPENELEAEGAMDEGDPNYVENERTMEEGVVGEVEVAKTLEGREGVARIELHPRLNV